MWRRTIQKASLSVVLTMISSGQVYGNKEAGLEIPPVSVMTEENSNRPNTIDQPIQKQRAFRENHGKR